MFRVNMTTRGTVPREHRARCACTCSLSPMAGLQPGHSEIARDMHARARCRLPQPGGSEIAPDVDSEDPPPRQRALSIVHLSRKLGVADVDS